MPLSLYYSDVEYEYEEAQQEVTYTAKHSKDLMPLSLYLDVEYAYKEAIQEVTYV